MSEVMGVTRSGYYAWRKRAKSKRAIENEKLSQDIEGIFYEKKQIYGSPRITEELADKGIKVSRPRVARLMKKMHLRSKMKRKFVHTTDSNHSYELSPNLLERNFSVGMLNRAWVSDITYIHTQKGWVYLTIIMDLGDRRVIGWSISESMDAQSTVIQAWKRAINNRKPSPGLIFHSDRGSQYACKAFREELRKETNLLQSMSRKGNCWDNAPAEAFFKSIKTEWLYGKQFPDIKQAQLAVFEYIETFYNHNRKHKALGQMSPKQFLQKSKTINSIAKP